MTTELNTSEFAHYLEEKKYQAGQNLFNQNDVIDGCHIIVKGTVHGVVRDDELGRQAKMDLLFCDGEVLGMTDLMASSEGDDLRNFSAVATSEVSSLFISKQAFQNMQKDEKASAFFFKLALKSASKNTFSSHKSMAQDSLLSSAIPEVDFMVANAVLAQQKIQSFSETFIDQVIDDVALEINQHADELAEQTVLESNMGVKEHKVLKIGLGSIEVAKTLVGKTGIGSMSEPEKGVRTIHTPMGVVFGMIPITNPVETILFKFLSALKSRNAIIVSSHRKGRDVGLKTVKIIQSVLKKHGAPINLIQAPQLPASRAVTNAFMSHIDVNFILATGGPSMVKSAYQSGTPAIGVGKGNAPVWICQDSNLKQAAQDVINSKSFDNGIVCGSENNLIVDHVVQEEFIKHAESFGAIMLSQEELQTLIDQAFSSGRLDAQWVGRSAADICEYLNITRDYEIKLILAKVEEDQLDSPFLKEKLAPVLSLSVVNTDQQALNLAKQILQGEGSGHTAIIHSQDDQLIKQYGQAVDVSRILVNTPGTQGCIGAANGLQLSWTLGCGTQGGGSTSDNVTYKHLMNTKRIANSW
jgi:acetaldehyde dehydrogenase/alcohol dehydrogenase